MSFAKIAEARAVKKIVEYIRIRGGRYEVIECRNEELLGLADDVEDGKWKDIVLPRPKKKGKTK